MRRAALSALLSHWRRSPFQLATLLLGLALATALWSGVQAINAEARASYAQAAALLGETDLARLEVQDGGAIPQAQYVALRRAGWQVSPVLEGWIRLGDRRYRLVGVDPVTAPGGTTIPVLPDMESPAGFFTQPGLFFAAPETLERIESDLDIRASEAVTPRTLVGDIGQVQRLLDRPGEISRLIVAAEQPLGLAPLAEIAPRLTLIAPSGETDLTRLTDSFHLNLTAFGFLSFAVGLLIVNGAIGLAFEQRRPLVRTLRALGVPLGTMVWLLSAELLLLALTGGAIGVALGYLMAGALLPDVAATIHGLYGAALPGMISFRPEWWAAGFGIALGGTALAAVSRLWRVARMPLLAPAQPRAWSLASRRGIALQSLAALALLAVAGLAAQFGTGLPGAFLLLGGLLVGAALLLPFVLHMALSTGARLARKVVAQWVWADTRQQLPGLSLALMALLLALAANIGVGTMVSSFRLTFTGWLDQRLVSALYVNAPSDAEGDRLRAWLEDRADRVLPIWDIETRILGAPADIYGIVDDPIYPATFPLVAAKPDVWERHLAGEALINEQLARREALWPGDRLALPGWETEIAGVYSDYGNPNAQVILPLPLALERYPDLDRRSYGVDVPPEEVAALMAALRDEFGLAETAMIDQAQLKSVSLSVFERTFAVTAALNVLTLGVAGVAMLTSLLTLATMRLPQLAPVWALGLTRRRLAELELLRALLLAAFTALTAVPVGLVLAWVLLTIVNVEAFGWRLPMYLFPGQWVWMVGLALLAAALAAAWPARRLARTPPAELLKVFAHER